MSTYGGGLQEQRPADCAICLESVDLEYAALDNCAHVFHAECIEKAYSETERKAAVLADGCEL